VVTFLFTDIEGSTRRWEADADAMREALAAHDKVLREAIEAHGGWLFKHTGDGVCAAFASPRSAVDAAVAAQRALQLPVRMGITTGEAELRGADYFGRVLNRAARLMAAGHGGQILLAESTAGLLSGVDLLDLGTHPLRDLPRPERVMQLCHPDLRNDFPPLRTPKSSGAHNLPVQLTSFVGRAAQMTKVEKLLVDNRLVTLTGAGGAGKTRLAVEIAAYIAREFRDGVWYVDLAPITHPGVVPITVARALNLPDQSGRSTKDTLLRFVRDREMLILLDNCEHLLDASADLVVALLGAAPGLSVLATSREPIGATGEATWRVPSLSLTDEAIELFTDRARLAQADFTVTDDNAAAVSEICRCLDGIPLAIELAAARVRALSVAEIVDGLHDRFRLLTGGARTAVRRQQTLRASVDWSHALLTATERILLRRLAVFLGGFDLDAAQAVAGASDIERYQVLDQLSMLVDKSLVVAEDTKGRTRYRLLETVRQYAAEKLGESGEADAVWGRHRDYYTSLAAARRAGREQLIEQAETEIDNLRAAFGWSREHSDVELALALASSLQPLWQAGGRLREGLGWFDAALADLGAQHPEVAPAVRARALADRAMLAVWVGDADSLSQAQQALAIAREVGKPSLLVRALMACGLIAALVSAELAEPYFAEAVGLARAVNDRWRLSHILASHAMAAVNAGDPIRARGPAEEGRDLAEEIDDRFVSRQCRYCLGTAQWMSGDLVAAAAQLREVAVEAEAAHDVLVEVNSLGGLGVALAWQGDTAAARTAAVAAIEAGAELGGIYAATGYVTLASAAMAAGDIATLRDAAARPYPSALPQGTGLQRFFSAEAALGVGDLVAARRRADEAVTSTTGYFLSAALFARARVAIAQGEPEQGERDAHDALACAADAGAYVLIPDIIECLAHLAGDAGSHREATRLFGAAHSVRERRGAVRFKVWDTGYEASVAALQNAMGEKDFDAGWAEGAALSVEDAIAYARRGRGERKRPTSGWASLTPTELDVVRLVSEGLGNKDIATRLSVSARTVQTHLTHVYTKLGLTSRVQLAHEAARHR
jgi:predicted ATPase/DNA-binding CsgD family transcriptional regulator